MLYYHSLRSGYLIFKGSERLDLINRLSTNQVDKLLQFHGLKTILTTEKGRFVDILTLYSFKDFVFTTCSFGYNVKVKTHLDKYTILDDFQCKDMTGTHNSILFFGIDSEKLASKEFSFELENYVNNDFKIINDLKIDLIIAKNDDLFGGFIIIYPNEAKEEFEKKYLSEAISKKYNLQNINEGVYNSMRIENGIPAMGYEMNENTNPLECGLNKYVSFNKGCYIGQEVIARLDTYDKISKHLVGIKFEDNFKLEQSTENSVLLKDGNDCGYITSTTHSNKFGNIGLAFVKTPYLDHSKDYFVRTGKILYKCKLSKLPFQ